MTGQSQASLLARANRMGGDPIPVDLAVDMIDTIFVHANGSLLTEVTGGDFTLDATHLQGVVAVNDGANQVDVTVPAGVFAAGQEIELAMTGTGFMRFLPAATMTVLPPVGYSTSTLTGLGAYAKLKFISATVCRILSVSDMVREVLKGFSNIHAAIGSRRLVPGYAGRAFLLRETGASADLGIGFDANGFFDDNSAFEHEGGNALAVDTAYDHSGNSRDFIQQTAEANQPALTRNSINGHPAMVFDGINDYLVRTTSADELHGGAMTIVFALKGNNGSTTAVYGEANSAAANQVYRPLADSVAGASRVFIADDAGGTVLAAQNFDAGTPFDDTVVSLAITDSGGALNQYIDGVQTGSEITYTPGTLTINRAAIGAVFRNAASETEWAGSIVEAFLFNAVLSAAEIKVIAQNHSQLLAI